MLERSREREDRRWWSRSLCVSSSAAPDSLIADCMQRSTLGLRPSDTFGTHSTQSGIPSQHPFSRRPARERSASIRLFTLYRGASRLDTRSGSQATGSADAAVDTGPDVSDLRLGAHRSDDGRRPADLLHSCILSGRRVRGLHPRRLRGGRLHGQPRRQLDDLSVACNEVGLLFACVNLITGCLWAKTRLGPFTGLGTPA